MELNNQKGPKMTVSKTTARMWADRLEWSVRKFEKAGLVSISLVRGNVKAGDLIDRDDHVLLGQLGEDYLIGKLKQK